eukprot:UN07698
MSQPISIHLNGQQNIAITNAATSPSTHATTNITNYDDDDDDDDDTLSSDSTSHTQQDTNTTSNTTHNNTPATGNNNSSVTNTRIFPSQFPIDDISYTHPDMPIPMIAWVIQHYNLPAAFSHLKDKEQKFVIVLQQAVNGKSTDPMHILQKNYNPPPPSKVVAPIANGND